MNNKLRFILELLALTLSVMPLFGIFIYLCIM